MIEMRIAPKQGPKDGGEENRIQNNLMEGSNKDLGVFFFFFFSLFLLYQARRPGLQDDSQKPKLGTMSSKRERRVIEQMRENRKL